MDCRKQIKELYDEKEKIVELSQNSRELYYAEFSVNQMFKNTIGNY